MATDPIFASTVKAGTPALLGAAETSLTVPTTASTIYTAGASGSFIERIVINAATTSLAPAIVAGLVYIFLHDGTTAHLFDTLTIPLPSATASATVPPLTLVRLVGISVPSGYTVRASQSIVGNANLLKVTALGADY